MKLKKKAWHDLLVYAQSQGFEGKSIAGPKGRTALKDYLTVEEIDVAVDGKSIQAKALTVELSEDQRQALITQTPDEEPEANMEEDDEEEMPKGVDPVSVEMKIKSAIEDALGKAGRPPVDYSGTQVSNVKTGEQLRYEDKVKRGQSFFKGDDAYAKAKTAALTLGIIGTADGPGANPDLVSQHVDTLQKMVGSPDGKKSFGKASEGNYIKALASSPASSGGAWFRTQYSNDILRNVEEFGVVPRLVNVMTMTEKTLELPVRSGGVTGYYTAENAAITESSPTIGKDVLTAKDYKTLTQSSLEALRDATPDLADVVLYEHTRTMAQHMDDTVFKGDGSSTYGGRKGLTYTGAGGAFGTTASDGGYQVVGGGTASAHTATNLASLRGRLPVYARQNAVITGDPNIIDNTFLRLAQSLGGATMTEWQGNIVNAYSGHPIVPNFSMTNTALDASGDAIDLLFGDFNRAIAVGVRENPSLVRSDEAGFTSASVYFRMIFSWDFIIRDVGDATTAGPLVSFWQT
ncbi:MAG: phage major capsid protein [Myxococcales bacterium FL481]|nr:MAG: phage major capsid protein [Myxococcales bacterium FL481]